MTQPPLTPSHRAGLAPHRQWLILAVATGCVLVLAVLEPAAGRLFAPKPAPPPPAPAPGTFQASEEQWATLGLQQAGAASLSPTIETDGKIATDDDLTTQVFAPVSGQVAKVFVKAGDQVKKGQPLFQVQSPEYAQAQSDLAAAAAQVKLAQANEARLHALFDSAGGSQKDWRQSQADLVTAQSSLQADEGKLRAMGMSASEAAALETGQGGRGGALGGLTTVASPIDGVVTQRLIGVGQNIGSVSGGANGAAVVVSDLRKVWLSASVREADSSRVAIGQRLQIKVLALPDRTFEARIDYVGASIDPTTRRLTVRAEVDNPDGALKPEMFASFAVSTGPAHNAVVVPEQAVIYEGESARLWVAHPRTKTLELRQVQASDPADGRVEVIAGLKAGEWIVTSGALFIDRASKPD